MGASLDRDYPDELLATWVSEASERSLALVSDLSPEQLDVPLLPTINPILWEYCHLAYFYERFVLRDVAGQAPARDDVDALFDSMTIGHENRWRLPVPDREGSIAYVRGVRDRVLDLIGHGIESELLRYRIIYSVHHEDMHVEALTYLRQTLGYPAPHGDGRPAPAPPVEASNGDIECPGGRFDLGAAPGSGFCFDNEKWAHPVDLAPFAISRTAVTEGEFAAFIRDGGYRREELWSREGWAWRQSTQAESPLFWRRDGGAFERRHFDRWVPIEERTAICHVSGYEAEAWCRWADRRLPTEAEWEFASSFDPATGGKRKFPWGDESRERVCHTDGGPLGPVSVDNHPEGDSALGCRQMLGNTWEWTSTVFHPFPGFEPDMYTDYSTMSFGTRNVLRGGAWATPLRMLRNTWRNFYPPARRDVFVGFRTCRV